MKKFPYSLTVALVAAVVLVATPKVAPAAGQQWPESANTGLEKDQMLLAQAETSAHKRTKKPLVNVDEHGVILKGYDAVAYFKQSKAVKGDPKYASSYEGATYYFASAQDKSEFDKAPAKYAPQYGGFCANSMRKRRIGDIDPNAFFIYKGKLYVCTNDTGLKEFKAKPDENIDAADKNWEFYKVPSNPGFRRYLGG
ncbi:MAG: YHS domain-containing protein [Verrucomicrobia bacterium]|nr:YHS domain-containing protein [Verrucomicrobiota bacterium]